MSPRKKTDKTSGETELDEVVRQLAALLAKAAPLAERLDSPDSSSVHRARLRELVGPETYFELANALNRMCSQRAWEVGHAKDDQARRALPRPKTAGAVFDRQRMRLIPRDEESQ